MNQNISELFHSYTVQEVPASVSYIKNFITEEEERDIINKINNSPIPKWTQLSNRRLQNWGGIPHPKGMIAEEIPEWLQFYVKKIKSINVFTNGKEPNHVLINEYLPGQGIMPHSDGPLFHPIVTTISCGSTTVLDFYKKLDSNDTKTTEYSFSLLLEPRSLLILQEDLYHNYLHSISEKSNDCISFSNIKNLSLCSNKYFEKQLLERSKRLSVTIRHVPKTTKLSLKFAKQYK